MLMYKVVRRTRHYTLPTLSSVVATGVYFQRFSTEEFSKAKLGGFFVFDNEKDALDFMGWNRNCELWLVEVREEVKLPLGYDGCIVIDWYPKCWNNDFIIPGEPNHSFPKGTRAFKQVKLVRKIYDGDDMVLSFGN